jgi:hypothetical protein
LRRSAPSGSQRVGTRCNKLRPVEKGLLGRGLLSSRSGAVDSPALVSALRGHQRPAPGRHLVHRDLQQRVADRTPRPPHPTRGVHRSDRSGGGVIVNQSVHRTGTATPRRCREDCVLDQTSVVEPVGGSLNLSSVQIVRPMLRPMRRVFACETCSCRSAR